MSTHKNPILYAGYPDPDVARMGEDYYIVSSPFVYAPGVPLSHSKGPVHWELTNHCVKKLPFEKYTPLRHDPGTWVPSIRCYEGAFSVFILSMDKGILIARTRDPYSESECNVLCESEGWIDPYPFWGDDGRAYMISAYAKNRSGIEHRPLLVEMDPQCRCLLVEPGLIFDGEQITPTSEEPKMYKENGYYYILISSGSVETGWQSYLRSGPVYRSYDYKAVMHQRSSRVNGPHQEGWITSPDRRYWFIHFQDMMGLNRIVHLQPMYFLDGWPFIGQDQNGDGIGESVEGQPMPAEGISEHTIRQSDDSAEKALGLQWQRQANPNTSFYSLEEHPGYLWLYYYRNPDRENLFWYAPNVLTQIPREQKLFMTVKLSLSNGEDGDFDGIDTAGRDYGYTGLYYTGKGIQVGCYRGTVTDSTSEGEAGGKLIFSREAEEEQAWFRLTLEEDKTYGFSYSSDGGNLTWIEYSFPLERATWIDTKLCLWSCLQENRGSGGYCDYEHVEIK